MFRRSGGMTLIETLVAIAIMSGLVLVVTSLLVTTSNSEKRNRVISEVEYQASSIVYEIAQSIRNSSSITAPTVGVTANSLTLALVSIPAQNPTVYSTSSQTILVSKGGSANSQLSSNTVLINNLSFQNISAPGTKGAVQIYLTVSSINPGNKSELVYSTSRVTTVTLR